MTPDAVFELCLEIIERPFALIGAFSAYSTLDVQYYLISMERERATSPVANEKTPDELYVNSLTISTH